MKKLLSLFICICLTICTITAPVMAEDTQIPARVSGLLNAIGITTPDDNVNPAGTISRGQIALYAARLAGNKFTGQSVRYYNDVPEGSFCYDAVSTLVNLGALSVPEDKMFNPNNEVTYSEACKILMCVLGFTDYAEAKGGYPVGYDFMAKQTDLNMGLEGIEMNFKNVMQMLYNACHIVLLDPQAIVDSYTQWVPGKDTILSLGRDIYYVEGRVDKTNTASLIDEVSLKKGMVEIGGVEVYAGGSGIEKNLGHNVEAYYHKPESDKPGTMLYYYDDTEMSIINLETADYSRGVLTYEDENADKLKTLNIDTSVPILFNGKPVKENITDAFNATGAFSGTNYGHIEVIEYNNEVSLVHIKRFETIVVRYTNENQKMAWDEFRPGTYLLFDEEKYDRFDMYEAKSGTPVTYNHLQKGHILNIYKSFDKKAVEVYVSDATISGTATQIKDDEILIDGVFYKINKEIHSLSHLETGVNATFYLDANGAVCYMEPIVDENMFAYVYDIGSDKSPFSPTLKLKVYTITGEHKVVDVELPVSIDGISKTTKDDVLNALAASVDSGDTGTTPRQLVGFRFGSDGKVRNIDTAAASFDAAEEKGSLVRMVEFTGRGTQYYAASGTPGFYDQSGPELVPYKDTKVFVVPATTDPATEDHFRLTDKSFFDREAMFNISAYKTDATHRYADIIVVRHATVANVIQTDMPVMIDEIYQKLDKNGKPVKVIKGVQWGALFEAECAKDIVIKNINSASEEVANTRTPGITSVDDLRKGDLIRVAQGGDGKVCVVQVLHDFVRNQKPYWYGAVTAAKGELNSNVRATFTLTSGYVVDKWVDWDRKWDTVVRPPVLIDINYDEETSTEVDRSLFFTGDQVTIYDIEKDRVFAGSCDDITSYTSGYGGSYLIAAAVNFSQRGFYVYVYPGGM